MHRSNVQFALPGVRVAAGATEHGSTTTWRGTRDARVVSMRWIAMCVVVLLGGCFTLAASAGGTIDGGGRIDWTGQVSFGPNFARENGQVIRMMVDTRFYSLDGWVNVGVGIGVDLVDRAAGEREQHIGARVGGGGRIDTRAPAGTPSSDARLSFEYGLAWGPIDRTSSDAGESFAAKTGGVILDAALHTEGSGAEHVQLGARLAAEVMIWRPSQR